MISVTVYKDKNNHYTGFRCDGHAEYAEPGEDIVCSAVSVLTLNTCNAIEALTEDAALLIDALVIGMQSLSEQYSEFIHFEIEEV